MIDVNVSLHRWPFRRLAGDEPADLVERLRKNGVTQAWAGSFDALLHRDMAAVNARLAADCQTHGKDFLVPFGCVNPRLPEWQEDLRRCHEAFGMPGIRLHPNYHGYKLDDKVVAELLSMAAARGLIVQIALTMEDERTEHPLVHVMPASVDPLPRLVKQTPNLKLIVLNGKRMPRNRELVQSGSVQFDIAMVEALGGVGAMAKELSPGRILFGSHSPFFYFQSALLKLRESGLPPDHIDAIREGNARALLKK